MRGKLTGGVHSSCEMIKISLMNCSHGTPAVCPFSNNNRTGISLKEIYEERYGNGFLHFDWKLYPCIQDRIKNERVSMKKI